MPKDRSQNLLQVVAAQARRHRLGHVPAAVAGPGDPVHLGDELGWEHQVRAHGHAHTIAHAGDHVNSK